MSSLLKSVCCGQSLVQTDFAKSIYDALCEAGVTVHGGPGVIACGLVPASSAVTSFKLEYGTLDIAMEVRCPCGFVAS
jgi:hypothetical protein